MKLKISQKELLRIRKEIEAVSGAGISGDSLFVSIALPYNCNEETRDYAYALALALRRVNCNADTNATLSFSAPAISEQPYEVLSYIPIASPCIRVYTKSRTAESQNRIKKAIRYLSKLLSRHKDTKMYSIC